MQSIYLDDDDYDDDDDMFISTTFIKLGQSTGGDVKYTDCISAQSLDPNHIYMDKTVNNLMARLLPRSFVEFGVLLHCHRSQVFSCPCNIW